MLKEIKKKYNEFHDAIVIELFYGCNDGKYTINRNLSVIIKCQNELNNVTETITLLFEDVLLFQFKEIDQSSFIIYRTLIKEEDGCILFDFFPNVSHDSTLVENSNSDFKIKCRKADYEILNEELLKF